MSVARGADFLKGVGIGAAPLLRGYTATQLAPAPAEMILASDRGEPILARRPVGLGWTLAWTSDLKSRWATDWLKWGRFGRFLGQMIREHQRTDDTEIRPMTVELLGDDVVASLEAFDKNENFDSALSSTLTIRHLQAKSADTEPLTVSFGQVAPGLYQARATLPQFGSYSLKATHQRRTNDGKPRSSGVSFGSVSRPYPEEYLDLVPRSASLAKWARLAGGKSAFTTKDVWSPGSDSVKASSERQNHLIFLALAFFLLDLLLRRVRIFDRNFRS